MLSTVSATFNIQGDGVQLYLVCYVGKGVQVRSRGQIGGVIWVFDLRD